MTLLVDLGVGSLSSFIGSFIAIVVVLHYDIEGWWEQRRLEHGKQLDERQRKAAEEHGKRKD